MQCRWRYAIFRTFICRKTGNKENDHWIISTNFLVLYHAYCDDWSWYLFCFAVKVRINTNIFKRFYLLTVWFTITSVTVVKSIATRLGRFPSHFITVSSAFVALACIIIRFGCTCSKIATTIIYWGIKLTIYACFISFVTWVNPYPRSFSMRANKIIVTFWLFMASIRIIISMTDSSVDP